MFPKEDIVVGVGRHQFNRHVIFVLNPNSVHNQAPNENNSVSCLRYIPPMSPGSKLHRSFVKGFNLPAIHCHI